MSFEIYCGKRGSGKTALATDVSFINVVELKKFGKIYSNYMIDTDKCIFNDLLFLPYSKIGNDAIIIDDIFAYEILSRKLIETVMLFVVNASRKLNTLIILTGQDYTFFSPKFRRNADKIFYLDKELNTYYKGKGLEIKAVEVKEFTNYTRGYAQNYTRFFVAQKYLDVYDTKYKVNVMTRRKIRNELIKVLKNGDYSIEDKEIFIDMYSRTEKEFKEYTEIIA